MLCLSRPVACAASGIEPNRATTFPDPSSWTTGLLTFRRGDLYRQFCLCVHHLRLDALLSALSPLMWSISGRP